MYRREKNRSKTTMPRRKQGKNYRHQAPKKKQRKPYGGKTLPYPDPQDEYKAA